MSDDKPYDWRNDPALSFGAGHPDLPPLPELNSAPEPAEPPKQAVPPRFTSDLLTALSQSPEVVKRGRLNEDLSRRARVADDSEAAHILDERIAQIRAMLSEPSRTPPTAVESHAASPAVRVKAKARPGPKRDTETASRVAEIVRQVADGQPWKSKLEEICDALDEEQVRCPKTWRKHNLRTWADAAATEREKAIKAIAHHLKNAAGSNFLRTFSNYL